jgi:hypothetical protein
VGGGTGEQATAVDVHRQEPDEQGDQRDHQRPEEDDEGDGGRDVLVLAVDGPSTAATAAAPQIEKPVAMSSR